MHRLLSLAILALCAFAAQAQVRGGIPPLGQPIPPMGPTTPIATRPLFSPSAGACCPVSPLFDGRVHVRNLHRNFAEFFPVFWDGFYAEPNYVPVPVYVPEPEKPPAETTPPPESAEPLLIERQGDAFVRYGGMQPGHPSQQAGARRLSEYRASGKEAPRAVTLPPVVLVFRNTHRLEVRNYVITRSILYEYADSGAIPISLADLDVPATLRLNRERGVEFRLPLTPNEVVIRF